MTSARALRLLCAASLAASLGACGDFLTGPGLTQNPDVPVQATPAQLFSAIQAAQFTLFEGQLARDATMFTQQMAGVGNGAQQQYGSLYQLDEASASNSWTGFYTGGGLVDLRKLQQAARAAGDARWQGIAEIWEAFSLGTAASVWGDIPYREAVSSSSAPRLDPQQQVYQDVIALLDHGSGLLDGSGPGPGALDVVYGGDPGKWRRAAYTLKARFWLHMAERLGPPAYQAALAAAQQGISDAPTTVVQAVQGQAAGDFRTAHDTTQASGNIWAQMLLKKTEIVAGQALVSLLLARGNDPRLAGYFDAAAGSSPPAFRGADEHGQPVGGSPTSLLNSSVRRALNFHQPLVTWSENQLIMAEAKFQLGDAAGALGHLNAVRAAVGLPALAGPVTLAQIMTEKYIVQFQNIDAWSDYKRTCIPALQPAAGSDVPGRLPYPLAERLANPNIPLPSNAPARNWDDPQPCSSRS